MVGNTSNNSALDVLWLSVKDKGSMHGLRNYWRALSHDWSVQSAHTKSIMLKKTNPFWINIHDAPVNLITMSKQVRETYYRHFAHHKLNLLYFISKTCGLFNPFLFSPVLFFSVFYVLLLSRCNSVSLSVSGTSGCIIKTRRFLSSGRNLERLQCAHPGENPGNPDQGGGGEDADGVLWINFPSHFWAGTSEVHLWSTASIASLCD